MRVNLEGLLLVCKEALSVKEWVFKIVTDLLIKARTWGVILQLLISKMEALTRVTCMVFFILGVQMLKDN